MTAFKVGDTIDATLRGKVVRRPGVGNMVLLLTDKGHELVNLNRYEVSVVKRPAYRPTVGDVISGRTVKATPWKRGTVLVGDIHGDSVLDDIRNGVHFILLGDGLWHAVELDHDDDDFGGFSFDDIYDDEMFTVDRLPA